jgi:VWFA-related protein
MPGFRFQGCPVIAASLLLVLAFLSCPLGAQSQENDKAPSANRDQAQFNLRVTSNLVVVRVVVRDAQGKPVEGLHKDDFQLFDRGKLQNITQFDVETSELPPNTSGREASTTPGHAISQPQPALPGKFLALYFDDLDISDADMMISREAADRYIAANLKPKDRVGIFVSGKMLSDFTADPKQIHDALSKLQSSSRLLTRDHGCPDLSDYQAYEITQFANDTNIAAWKVALDEAFRRGCGGRSADRSPTGDIGEAPAAISPGTSPSSSAAMISTLQPASTGAETYPILTMARRIVEQSRIQALSNLEQLEHVVSYISKMPGQRTVLMVSPGFLSLTEQHRLDHVIDQALHSQVVISSLDPRGLALLMREVDVSNNYTPSTGAIAAEHSVDFAREGAATDVLAEVAYGTGGEFFHNDNDLKTGFARLGGASVSYILAFAPSDTKRDGKFHAVKVSLVEKHKGASIQARRGYFAPRSEAEAELENKQDAEAQAQEQIREALLSNIIIRQLPVVLFAQRVASSGETRGISFSTHLDVKELRLRKELDHNANTVIFALAIFDEKQHLIASQQTRALIHVPDAQLQSFLKSGVDAQMTFNLKPGPYTVREVVTNSEDHQMAAFSSEVKVP